MKDAPINLPPQAEQAWQEFCNSMWSPGADSSRWYRQIFGYAWNAAVLADRAGRQEPVARLHIRRTDTYLEADVEVLDGERLQPENSPVDVYFAAPSPAEPPAAPVQQEPVARVDANDDGMWADILPNVNVKVGQFLYAHPDADLRVTGSLATHVGIEVKLNEKIENLRAELASAEARYNYESKRCDQAEVALKRAEAERDSLRAALQGVIRVADRNTDEFNAAKAALKGTRG